MNLGHGILPETPVEHAQLLVEVVKARAVDKAVYSKATKKLISPTKIAEVDRMLIKEGKITNGGHGVYPRRGTTHYDHGPAGRRWSGKSWKAPLAAPKTT